MRAKANLLPALLLLLFVASIFPVHADMWPLPEKKKYYSPNKKYYLEVTPKKLENQLKYFQIKLQDGPTRAPHKLLQMSAELQAPPWLFRKTSFSRNLSVATA